MDSQDILRRAVAEAKKRGYRVGNVDIAVHRGKAQARPAHREDEGPTCRPPSA